MGDNKLLVSGGILNQPAAMYFEAQTVGWVWDVLRRYSKPDRNMSDFSEDEIELTKKINKIRGKPG